MIYTEKCENCGDSYDAYMRTFYVEEKGCKKCVCLDCQSKLKKGKIWYTNYIPNFVDGGSIVTRIFGGLKEMEKYIHNDTLKDFIATISDYCVVDVCKTRKEWWVRGYVSHKINLPTFNETREKLGYTD